MIVNTLKFLVESRLITPTIIAAESELNYTTVRKILLNRDVIPNGNTLSQLCSLFQVSVGTIVQHLNIADRFKDEFYNLPVPEQVRIIDCSRFFHVEKSRNVFSNEPIRYPINYDYYETSDYSTLDNLEAVVKYFEGTLTEDLPKIY